jgi:hypothetical protein
MSEAAEAASVEAWARWVCRYEGLNPDAPVADNVREMLAGQPGTPMWRYREDDARMIMDAIASPPLPAPLASEGGR